MSTVDIMAFCMVVSVASFMGFVVENIWLALTKGYMDNRNMCFPFLLGYGIAMLLIYMILGIPENLWILGKPIQIQSRTLRILIYFAGVMLCVGVGEILLGTFVERTCGFYWWDYSGLPFHITRYTSLPTGILFSLMATAFMDGAFEQLFSFFCRWNYSVLCVAATGLVALMALDLVVNAGKMYKRRGLIYRWRIQINPRACLESWLKMLYHIYKCIFVKGWF